MSDMDRFLQIYFAESSELLVEMEELLSDLQELTEGQDADPEVLNAVFRCAHSIKGGAGAFGFDKITSFTHEVEALLDKLRDGSLHINEGMTFTLLRSVDVMAKMLETVQAGGEIEEDFGGDVQKEIEAHAAGAGAAAASAAGAETPAAASGGDGRYLLTLTADEDMLDSGNEPLLVLRELKQAVKVENIAADSEPIPDLESIAFDKVYLQWKVELVSESGTDPVDDVFAFAEGCEYTIEPVSGASPGATAETPSAAPAAPAEVADAETEKPAAIPSPPAPAATAAAKKPAGPAPAAAAGGGISSVRVDLDKIDRMLNMVGEMVITQAMISTQVARLPVDSYPELLHGIDELYRHSRELQEAVMAVRMQPVKSVFSRMPRIVRDLARQLDKDVRLITEGENTEIDKTVIEQLADPLTHMIRNSVDHGIEKPEKRLEKGKPKQGTIKLSADHEGGKIIIEITDDGAGVNRERVTEKAIEKGIIPADHKLSDAEIDMLIFAPGFSTAEAVTNVSGRGVGMDVVKRNIENAGGTVEVRSNPGKGTVMRILLPLTLAILDGMVVRIGQEKYIVPIADISEMLRPQAGDIKPVVGSADVIKVRDSFIPLAYLADIFEVSGAETEPTKALVLLVENGANRYGLVVDELIGQQQVVIKSLEENADPVPGVSGATILGDGKVALIVDSSKIYHLSMAAIHAAHRKSA